MARADTYRPTMDRIGSPLRLLLGCLMVLVVSVGCLMDVDASPMSRRVLTDSTSGLALFGYDPVAYFTDGQAIRGQHQYEWVWKGVSWTFASRANREVFRQDPEIYAPQFGGHGALAMARGYVSAANPRIWAIYRDKLYLFYSYPSRVAWAEELDKHVERGDAAWIEIEPTLSR